MARSYARRAAAIFIAVVTLVLSTAIGLQPDDVPAARRARRALIDHDLPQAIALYEIALQAEPDNSLNWYYYACALTLSGRTSDALTALDNAAATGYADSSWIAIDPDLAPLRSSSRFAAVLTRMGVQARGRGRGWEDLQDRPFIAAQTRFSSYELDLPLDYSAAGTRRYPLVLLLHGRGMNAESMLRLESDLALPEMIFARMNAPYPSGEGYEYWPAPGSGGTRAADIRSPVEDEWMTKAARFTAQWYGEIVRDAARRVRVDTTCVIIAGFSQGAAMAWIAAMDEPATFTGVAALSGWILPSHDRPDRFDALARNHVALFIAHGVQDNVIPPEQATAVAEKAKAAGVDTTIRLYPVGHTISPDIVADLAGWIRDQCSRGAPR